MALTECTVAQLESLFKLKLLKDDDDKVLNELSSSDTVFDIMSNSNSDSDSDTGLSAVFGFFRHIETVNVFPAPSAIPRIPKEQIQQSDVAIKSLLVQLDEFMARR
ncbi:hypothetical protein CPC16_008638 [Podila verticillata]|nr:hypothetical protein CPC16_008638 [Podila verticillata]